MIRHLSRCNSGPPRVRSPRSLVPLPILINYPISLARVWIGTRRRALEARIDDCHVSAKRTYRRTELTLITRTLLAENLRRNPL